MLTLMEFFELRKVAHLEQTNLPSELLGKFSSSLRSSVKSYEKIPRGHLLGFDHKISETELKKNLNASDVKILGKDEHGQIIYTVME